MTDLLSAIDKANIHLAFDDIHDTFARNITIYVKKNETIIDTDGSHNPLYGNIGGGNNRQGNGPEYQIFTKKARIKYMGLQDRAYNPEGANSPINVNFPIGTIRLKVDSETYQIITKSKKIQVDDRLCELVGDPARPGPFNPNYWTIELKQVG